MPTITEKARAEAEEAEREEHEHEPDQADPNNGDEGQEQPAEPHPGEGLEEPSDAMMEELRAACNDHHDHVRQIMGPFVAEFEPCDECNGIGLAYPRPKVPQLESAPQATACNVCKGHGELLTGSKRSGYEKVQCLNCSGHGWVGAGNLPPTEAARQAVESFPAGDQQQQPAAPAQPGSTDPRVAELEATGRFIILEKPGA